MQIGAVRTAQGLGGHSVVFWFQIQRVLVEAVFHKILRDMYNFEKQKGREHILGGGDKRRKELVRGKQCYVHELTRT